MSTTIPPPSVHPRARDLSANASGAPVEVSPPLSPSAQALAGAALAPATVRAYRSALAALDRWLAEHGRAADDAALADYLAARHDAGAAPTSISMSVAAVKAAARLSGQPSPAGPETARVLAGIRREGRGRGAGAGQGAAMGRRRCRRGRGSQGRPNQARGGCATRPSWRSRPIASCACPKSSPSRSWTSRPKRTGPGASPSAAAKPTRKARARCSTSAPQPCAGSRHGGKKPTSRPARCSSASAGSITSRTPRSRRARPGRSFKARAADAGIEGRVSGHSLRIGAAQSLAAAGAGLVELQQAGRWDSPAMPGHYARGQLAARGAVARLRHRKGR